MPADGSAALYLLRRAGGADRRCRDRRPHGCDLRRVRGLRLPPRRRRTAPPGCRRQRQEDPPADARARPAAQAPPAVRRHHRQRSQQPDLPGPGQGHGGRRSEPALGRRPHLHRDRDRLRLSRRNPRRLVAPGGRVCDQPLARRPTHAGGTQGRAPTRRPPAGCMHHSDRGAQYASEIYRQLLAEHGLVGSMGRRGNPTTMQRPRVS